jgi:hypothetical protein
VSIGAEDFIVHEAFEERFDKILSEGVRTAAKRIVYLAVMKCSVQRLLWG